MQKRSIVACDQYTSQPEYRKEAKTIVWDSPSTLNIIFPEVYLEEDGKEERIQDIQKYMNEYINSGLLENQGSCFILVDRKTSHTDSRKWLVVGLDLEHYNYNVWSQTLIRATEGTIVDRLPPRIEVRKDAPLESPHIMVLIDDPEKTVIEPLFAKLEQFQKVYDTDLMLNGWHITWYKIADEESIENIVKALEHIADKELFKNKYGVGDNLGVLLFAMWDGNHSLATAKAIREKVKQDLSEEEKENNPARFAIVELVNIHDNGLVFEPIHRVVFNIDPQDLIENMKKYFATSGSELVLTEYSNAEEMKSNVKESTDVSHFFTIVYGWKYIVAELKNPKLTLEVANLQAFLDDYLKTHTDGKIDYVHGEDVTTQLANQEWNIGFMLPIMHKSAFFKTVIVDGALPRKTFSMGEAEEKRYYIECRKIK